MGLFRWVWIHLNPIYFVKTSRVLAKGENLSKESDRKLTSQGVLKGHEFNSVKSVYVCVLIYAFVYWFDGYFGNEFNRNFFYSFAFVPYTIPWCFYFLPQASVRTIFFLKKKRRRKQRVVREWRYFDGSRGLVAQVALSIAYVLCMPYAHATEDTLQRYEIIPTAGWAILGVLALYGFLHQSWVLISTIPRRIRLVGIEITHMTFFFITLFCLLALFLVIPSVVVAFIHFQFDVPLSVLSDSMFGIEPLSDFWFNRN